MDGLHPIFNDFLDYNEDQWINAAMQQGEFEMEDDLVSHTFSHANSHAKAHAPTMEEMPQPLPEENPTTDCLGLQQLGRAARREGPATYNFQSAAFAQGPPIPTSTATETHRRPRKATPSPSSITFEYGTTPIPADIVALVNAINALPHKSGHPKRAALKEQKLSDHFWTSRGIMKESSPLFAYKGDLRLFTATAWRFLVCQKKRETYDGMQEVGRSSQVVQDEDVREVMQGVEDEQNGVHAGPDEQVWAAVDGWATEEQIQYEQ